MERYEDTEEEKVKRKIIDFDSVSFTDYNRVIISSLIQAIILLSETMKNFFLLLYHYPEQSHAN